MMREMFSKRRKFFAFILSVGLAVWSFALPARSVTLAWSPGDGATVVGFMVCCGTDGINFNIQVDVKTNTSWTASGLQPGTTNYFEVVAYDANYNKSPPSGVLEYVVPNLLRTIIIQTNCNFALLVNGIGTVTSNSGPTELQPGKKYTLTAMPGKGWVFSNWLGNDTVASTKREYIVTVQSNLVLQANFAPNPFPPAVGTYHGLYYAANAPAEESSGAFVATVTDSGAFNARLRHGTGSYMCSGKFSLAGVASNSIARPGSTPLAVQLQLDLVNGPLTGTVSDGVWTASLTADSAIYSKTNPAPEEGRYTLLIPASTNASVQPGGTGFGSVAVDAFGNVSIAGRLGDGTPFTSSSVVAGQGQWPFYVSLYGGKGSILGWLSFINGGISGEVGWFKLPEPMARLYPAGFTINAEVIGSVDRYTVSH